MRDQVPTATTFTTPWWCLKNMKFYFTTTLTTLWSISKRKRSLYYSHYLDDHDRYIYIYISTLHSLQGSTSTFTTLWLWKKKIVFMLVLRSLCFDRAKKNKSIHILTLLSLSIYLVVAATFTTPWSWHKTNFYSNTIFTTQILIKKE